jgi:hypothetical protein
VGGSLSNVCFVSDLETNHWLPHYEGVISAMSGIKPYSPRLGIARCPGGLRLGRVEVAAAMKILRSGLRSRKAVLAKDGKSPC